jgi:hypothetical protein
MKRFRRVAFVMAVMMLVGSLVPSLALAAPGDNAGNAGNAGACRGSGYENWTRADGSTFDNAGQCIRYTASGPNGGTLAPVPAPTITVEANLIRLAEIGPGDGLIDPDNPPPTPSHDACQITSIEGAHFAPNTTYVIEFYQVHGEVRDFSANIDGITTDSAGAFVLAPGSPMNFSLGHAELGTANAIDVDVRPASSSTPVVSAQVCQQQ